MTTCVIGSDGRTYFLSNGRLVSPPPGTPTCFMPYPVVPAPQTPYRMVSEPRVIDVPGFPPEPAPSPVITVPTPAPGAIVVTPTPPVVPPQTCSLAELQRQREEIKSLQAQLDQIIPYQLNACRTGANPLECLSQLYGINPGLFPPPAPTPTTPGIIGIPPPVIPEATTPLQPVTVRRTTGGESRVSQVLAPPAPTGIPEAPPLAPEPFISPPIRRGPAPPLVTAPVMGGPTLLQQIQTGTPLQGGEYGCRPYDEVYDTTTQTCIPRTQCRDGKNIIGKECRPGVVSPPPTLSGLEKALQSAQATQSALIQQLGLRRKALYEEGEEWEDGAVTSLPSDGPVTHYPPYSLRYYPEYELENYPEYVTYNP